MKMFKLPFLKEPIVLFKCKDEYYANSIRTIRYLLIRYIDYDFNTPYEERKIAIENIKKASNYLLEVYENDTVDTFE